MYFDAGNPDAIDDYVKSSDYASVGGKTPICFGIVFDSSVKGNWNYQMRWNVSSEKDLSNRKEKGQPADHATTAFDRIDFLKWYFISNLHKSDFILGEIRGL